MTHRVHVTLEVELFVDDDDAFRQAAFERMRAAWRSEDDFPFDAPGDIPLGQAVQSLLADAIPVDLPGARRSQLVMETEEVEQDDETASQDDQDDDQDDDKDDDQDDDEGDASEGDEDTETDPRT